MYNLIDTAIRSEQKVLFKRLSDDKYINTKQLEKVKALPDCITFTEKDVRYIIPYTAITEIKIYN